MNKRRREEERKREGNEEAKLLSIFSFSLSPPYPYILCVRNIIIVCSSSVFSGTVPFNNNLRET